MLFLIELDETFLRLAGVDTELYEEETQEVLRFQMNEHLESWCLQQLMLKRAGKEDGKDRSCCCSAGSSGPQNASDSGGDSSDHLTKSPAEVAEGVVAEFRAHATTPSVDQAVVAYSSLVLLLLVIACFVYTKASGYPMAPGGGRVGPTKAPTSAPHTGG